MRDENKVSPWKLTPMEALVLDTIIELGHQKLACRKLNLELKSVQCHSYNGRKKIGGRGLITAYIKWDRWRRSGDAGGSTPAVNSSTGTAGCPSSARTFGE